MAIAIPLYRQVYMKPGALLNGLRTLDYLSARYKNIKHLLAPDKSYRITHLDEANAPGLSLKFYGDMQYWWVICLYNGILDPISGFEPGSTILLPKVSDINALLASSPGDNSTVLL